MAHLEVTQGKQVLVVFTWQCAQLNPWMYMQVAVLQCSMYHWACKHCRETAAPLADLCSARESQRVHIILKPEQNLAQQIHSKTVQWCFVYRTP